jgi:hypothetical protein
VKDLKLRTTKGNSAKMVVLGTSLAALTSVSPAQGQSSTTKCSTNAYGTTTCQTDEKSNRPNDYSIESPMKAFQESYEFSNAVRDKKRADQELQQRTKRQENLQTDLDILIKSNPTVQDFANFILKYPEAQERVEGYLEMIASDNPKGVPSVAAPTQITISSDFKPNSIGWLWEVCEKDTVRCAHFIEGSISAALFDGVQFCPPKWVAANDYPRVIVSYAIDNPSMQTDFSAQLLVRNALLAQFPCPKNPETSSKKSQ